MGELNWRELREGSRPCIQSVTAGRGGGGMLVMFVVFLLLFMSFLHFLVHLLVNHYSWSYYTRNQWIHRTHARARCGGG